MAGSEGLILDWTSKQGRILTGGGKAAELYTKERGYPFQDEELPHHHLIDKTTEFQFFSWASKIKEKNPVCGVFFRPLFVGGFEYSTHLDEVVYNVQTNTLFIDMRIPRVKENLFKDVKGFKDMDCNQLKLFARRHAFAGYTRLCHENNRPVCTRHHCIDWNFVGIPRPRPNKWYVDMNADSSIWKELSYARNEYNQHYYWEQWERYEHDGYGNGLVLALRKEKTKEKIELERDGIIVVVGDHFNYILDRQKGTIQKEFQEESMVNIVDALIESGDRTTAESYLSIDAGHGLISNGWVIDCALQHWKEGSKFFEKDSVEVSGDTPFRVLIEGIPWKVYECNVKHDELQDIFQGKAGNINGPSKRRKK